MVEWTRYVYLLIFWPSKNGLKPGHTVMIFCRDLSYWNQLQDTGSPLCNVLHFVAHPLRGKLGDQWLVSSRHTRWRYRSGWLLSLNHLRSFRFCVYEYSDFVAIRSLWDLTVFCHNNLLLTSTVTLSRTGLWKENSTAWVAIPCFWLGFCGVNASRINTDWTVCAERRYNLRSSVPGGRPLTTWV